MNIRFFIFLACFWPSVSIALELVFRESHFLGQYRHEIYIKDKQYVYIDDHFELDGDSNWIPKTPEIKLSTIGVVSQDKLIEQLIELGVNDWEPQYPQNDIPLICDGLSFTIFIKSENLNVYSSGSCRFPPNYENVRQILEDL